VERIGDEIERNRANHGGVEWQQRQSRNVHAEGDIPRTGLSAHDARRLLEGEIDRREPRGVDFPVHGPKPLERQLHPPDLAQDRVELLPHPGVARLLDHQLHRAVDRGERVLQLV
jgi:hypothetical protein